MKFKRKNYTQQLDQKDCGLAVLSMVLKHYGSNIHISTLRSLSKTTIEGTSLFGLVKAAEFFNLDSKAIKTDINIFFEKKIQLPVVAHVKNDDNGYHFCLITNCKKNRITIADPNPNKKIYSININEFANKWTGVLLFLTPAPNYSPTKEKNSSLWEVGQELLKDKKITLSILTSSFLIALISIVSSYFTQVIIDEFIPLKLKQSIYALVLAFGIIYILKSILEYSKEYLLLVLSQRMSIDILLPYLRHVFRLPVDFFQTRRSGEIISRFSDAMLLIETISKAISSTFMSIIAGFIISIVLILQNPFLFFVSIILIPVVLAFIFITRNHYFSLNSKSLELNSKLSSTIIEDINGIETIKSLSAESCRLEEIDLQFTEHLDSVYRKNKFTIYFYVIKNILQEYTRLLIMLVGSYMIIDGNITIGRFIAFQSLMSYLLSSVGDVLDFYPKIQLSKISNIRINDILHTEKEKTMGLESGDLSGDIVLEKLSFQYGYGRVILEDISLKIEEKSKVALLGESGCGKSTLAKLLTKMCDLSSGRILINNLNINDINTNYLRKRVCYVPQKSYVFTGTILENLTLNSPQFDFEKVNEVIDLCELTNFINSLPQGVYTHINSESMTLSGGEKQRLALARALLSNPTILILDEATSNLDVITENKIIDRLLQLEKTVIFIAHRLSIAKKCDQIFYIKDGKVAEKGKHDELLNIQGLYYEVINNGIEGR